MIQRLPVVVVGIAVAMGLFAVGMGQTQKKTKKPPAEARKSEGESASVADPPRDEGGTAQQEGKEGNQSKDNAGGTKEKKIEKATFGGGCFWCMEAVFERVPGVKSVVSGFSGGNVPSPTYEMVCTGLTGHAEVVQIEYDPVVVTYDKLLKVFWSAHDPTTLNSQGPDFGTQYRSIILYHDEEQKKAAQKSYRELSARRAHRSPIVTELVPFVEFYPADLHHQDYYRNHPDSDYSQMYIEPKVRKLRQKLK
jgi:peptide-methionine (S)-S-oxide reductase